MPSPLVTITDACPSIIINDTTDYSELIATGTYKPHNYDTNPTASFNHTVTSITIDGVEVLGATVNFPTNASSLYSDAQERFEALEDQVNTYQSNWVCELIGPGVTENTKNWYFKFSRYGSGFSGDVISVTSTLTPVITNITGGGEITSRSINIISPEGAYLNTSNIAQVDTLTLLLPNYTVGSVFTFTFCGSTATYPVVSGETASACVAKGISDMFNALTGSTNKLTKMTSEPIQNTVVFTSKEPGVPMQMSVTYSLVGSYFTFLNTVANQSNMDLPDFDIDNFIEYTANESGGEYTAVINIVDSCVYERYEKKFFNWCKDKTDLNSCLFDLVKKELCGCEKCKDGLCNSSRLLSKIQAIDLMEAEAFNGQTIQEVVNSAKSICDCDCGC